MPFEKNSTLIIGRAPLIHPLTNKGSSYNIKRLISKILPDKRVLFKMAGGRWTDKKMFLLE